MRATLAMICILGCTKEAPPKTTAGSGSGSASAISEVTLVTAEVRGAMTELSSYTERLYKVMREAPDCDAAAKQLEVLVPTFAELGPRMMKLKERMGQLAPADRESVKQASETITAEMMKRFGDADVIEKKGRECTASSPAFAAVAPKVLFTKR